MDVLIVKVIVLIGLFIATYIFSLLPVKLMSIAAHTTDNNRRRKIDRLISFLSCFAAGVFLATCLLDIYPDVEDLLIKSVNATLQQSKYRDYPFAESVMIVGFFLVFIVEQIVLAIKESSHPIEMERQHQHSGSKKRADSRRRTYGSVEDPDEVNALLNQSDEHEFRPRSASITSARSITGISDRPSYSRSTSVNMGDVDASMHQDPNSHSPIRSFIMLAALSLHSVFEGLAVGLQVTINQVLSVFGALILHKCIIAFSIGLNLVQSKLTFKKIIMSNAAFCIASPLGVGIGILIDSYESKSSSNLTSGILQGLACGTFLYVTFFEVLPHEFNKPQDRILKLLFVVLGFAFVTGILFLEINLTS